MSKRAFIVSFIAIVGSVFMALCLLPNEYSELVKINFYVDLFAVDVVIILMGYYSSNYDFSIFDPMWILSFMYLMMYFITPIYDLVIGNHTWYGYSLLQYGVKSSIIALLGYISFYFVYSNDFIIRRNKLVETQNDEGVDSPGYDRDVSIPLILVIYGVCFVANAFYMIKYYGMSLQALLSFGLLQGEEVSATSSEIGFISMLSYSLPTVTLLYFEYGKSKALKVILFVPMFIMQVTRGFRFLVIQIIITFVSYYYVRMKKKPKISSLLAVFAVLMVFVLGMTIFREAMRWGGDVDLASVNSTRLQEAFDEAIWDNFRIYNNYYGIVGAIPSRYGYVYGREIIIGTIVMVIPRILWSGKISSSANAGLKAIIGPNIASGQASPNISEYYYACGTLGVMICMGVYAAVMKKAKNKMKSDDPLDIMIFSVLLGANIQLIIRSYTPSNFWYVIFALIPIWIIKQTSASYRIDQEIFVNE